MVVQFLLVLCSNLIDAIGGAVDAGFTNSIGINEIAVFGVVCSLHGFCYTFNMIGSYYYRLYGKNEKDCFYVTMVIGCIDMLILILLSDNIHMIYKVEPELYDLLRVSVICLAVTEPIRGISCLMQNYCLYTGRDKLNLVCLVIFYIMMFSLDAVALFIFRSLPLILLFTGVSNVVYVAIIYIRCKWYTKRASISGIINVFKGAVGYFGERITGRFSLEIRSIFAASLSTNVFVLYAVVNKVSEIWACTINSLQIFVLKNLRMSNEQTLKNSLKLHNKVGVVCFSTAIVMCIGAIFAVKGALPLSLVFLQNMIYFLIVYVCYAVHVIIYSVFILRVNESEKTFSGVVRLIGSLLFCIVLRLFGVQSYVYIFSNAVGILSQIAYMFMKVRKYDESSKIVSR